MFSNAAFDPLCRQEIFRLSTGNRLTDTWYEMITAESMQASYSDAFREYLDDWVNYEFFQEIKGCTIPLKIIVGENDPHLTYELMKNTFGQWFQNVDISMLSNCGHYPMYEIPLVLAMECECFLLKHCRHDQSIGV